VADSALGASANPGDLRLEVVAGKATGFSLVVGARLVIGRNSEGPGRLADDPELSRHHAEIARAQSGEFTIKDLASTNGTFVNGTRLKGAATLCVGDEIEVGGTRLAVRSAPVVAAPEATAVDTRATTVIRDVPPGLRQPPDQAKAGREPQPLASRQPPLVRLTVDVGEDALEFWVNGRGEPIRLVRVDGEWRLGSTGS